MPVDEALVRELAALARLSLSPEEIGAHARDLGRFLAYAHHIQAAPIAGGDAELLAVAGRASTPLRPDLPGPELGTDGALDGAPRTWGEFFVVPRVLE